MEPIKTAQAEMNSIVAERKVYAAPTRNIPPAADRTYKLGEEVLVLSEGKKERPGSYVVSNIEGRMITIQNKYGTYRQTFSAFQIQPSYRTFKQNLSTFKSSNE